MNKLGSLSGVGALYLDGELLGKAEYDISVNEEIVGGSKQAFGWMKVSERVIGLINDSVSNFTLELQKSGKVELAPTGIDGHTVNFEVSGPVPGF